MVNPSNVLLKLKDERETYEKKVFYLNQIRLMERTRAVQYERAVNWALENLRAQPQIYVAALRARLRLIGLTAMLGEAVDDTERLSVWRVAPADPSSCGTAQGAVETEKSVSVRKAAATYLEKHCLARDGLKAFVEGRLRRELFPNVRRVLLRTYARLVEREDDLRFLLERLERFTFEEAKEVLSGVQPLEHQAGLETLYQRLNAQEQKPTVVLPAAFLCGRWGLFGLQEILALPNPPENVVHAAMEGLVLGGAFEWDEIFPVESYLDLLSGTNAPMVELAAAVLSQGGRISWDVARKLKTTVDRADIERLTGFRVAEFAADIPLRDLYRRLGGSVEEKIDAIRLIVIRTMHMDFEQYDALEGLRTQLAPLLDDPEPAVRLATLRAYQTEKLKPKTFPTIVGQIERLLDDADEDVRRTAGEILGKFVRTAPELRRRAAAKIALALGRTAQPDGKVPVASRLAFVDSVATDDLKRPERWAAVVAMARDDRKPAVRSAALASLVAANPNDAGLEKILLTAMTTDSSPVTRADAIRLLLQLSTRDANRFARVLAAVRNVATPFQKEAFAEAFAAFAFEPAVFAGAAGKTVWAETFEKTLDAWKHFCSEAGQAAVAGWLDAWVVAVEGRLNGSWDVPWKKLGASLRDYDRRVSLLPVYARLFAKMPKRVAEELKGLRDKDGLTLVVDLVVGGNVKPVPAGVNPLTLQDPKAARNLAHMIALYQPKSGTIAATDVYALLEVLKANTDPYLRFHIAAKLDKLATRLPTTGARAVAECLAPIMDDATVHEPTRHYAASAIVNSAPNASDVVRRARLLVNELETGEAPEASTSSERCSTAIAAPVARPARRRAQPR